MAASVALVTGATRGAGKGIALGLASRGMTVYVTGRSKSEASATLKGEVLRGTLDETVAAIEAAGGKGIGIRCDHSDDDATRAVFAQIESEQNRLDILVNNAAHIHDNLIDPGGFWEKPLELAGILDVGLRSAYVASYYAAPIMVRQGSGLITFTSSFGGVCYMHGPAYGAQKAGYDKFAADMAVDLENTGVAVGIPVARPAPHRAHRGGAAPSGRAVRRFHGHGRNAAVQRASHPRPGQRSEARRKVRADPGNR